MNNNVEKFKTIIETMAKEFASPAEVKRLFDVLLKAFKELSADVGKKLALIKAEIAALKKDYNTRFDKVEAKIDSQTSTTEELINATRQRLEASVKALEKSIPNEIDLTDVNGRISSVEEEIRRISPLLTSDNIRNSLETLQGDEQLKLEALERLIEDVKNIKKSVYKLQGASQTPSPIHWPRHESFTMNGSDTSVTLTQAVGGAGTFIFGVRYNGQMLDKDNQYTVNGNKIELDFTPKNGTTISVSYMG